MRLVQALSRSTAVLGAAILLTGLSGTAAPAASDPWSPDPVVTDLFEQTSQGWMGTVPLGMTEETTMTITATRDIVLRSANTYSGTYTNFGWRLDGVCPRGFSSVRMSVGDTCTVTWTVHPQEFSSTSAGWSFYADPVEGGDRVQGSHNLSFGTVAVEAENLDFGPVPVGTSVTRPLTFRNVSAVDALVRLDAPGNGFTVTDLPVEPVLVPAGAEMSYDVVFTPTAVGTSGSSSWWNTTLPEGEGRRTDLVRFTGTGVYGDVTLDVPDVDFAEVSPGESVSREIGITNTGTAPADVFVANPEDLATVGVGVEFEGSTVLAPGGTARATLTWTPEAESYELVESLVVSYTAAADPQTGEGVPVVPVAATLSGRTPAPVVDPVPTDPVPTDPVPTDPEGTDSTDAGREVVEPPVIAHPSTPDADNAQGVSGSTATRPAHLAVTGARVALAAALAVALVVVGLGAMRFRRGRSHP